MVQVAQEGRGPGRPPKKGSSVSWKPATHTGTLNVPEGHTPRWCDGDPLKLQKKQLEGWVPVNKTNCPGFEMQGQGINGVKDGSAVDGGARYRELVGMMLPNEMKEARAEYFREKTIQQTRARVMMEEGDIGKERAELNRQGGKIQPTFRVE